MIQAHGIDFEIVEYKLKAQEQKAVFLRIGAGDSPKSITKQLQLVEIGNLLEFSERESDMAIIVPIAAGSNDASEAATSPSLLV